MADHIDEPDPRIVHDAALGGHAISLETMERSANRYLARRGDLPPSIPDAEVGPRVADHINRTSEGVRLMRQHYTDIGRPELFDLGTQIALIEGAESHPASAYAPTGYTAVYDGTGIRFVKDVT